MASRSRTNCGSHVVRITSVPDPRSDICASAHWINESISQKTEKTRRRRIMFSSHAAISPGSIRSWKEANKVKSTQKAAAAGFAPSLISLDTSISSLDAAYATILMADRAKTSRKNHTNKGANKANKTTRGSAADHHSESIFTWSMATAFSIYSQRCERGLEQV